MSTRQREKKKSSGDFKTTFIKKAGTGGCRPGVRGILSPRRASAKLVGNVRLRSSSIRGGEPLNLDPHVAAHVPPILQTESVWGALRYQDTPPKLIPGSR